MVQYAVILLLTLSIQKLMMVRCKARSPHLFWLQRLGKVPSGDLHLRMMLGLRKLQMIFRLQKWLLLEQPNLFLQDSHSMDQHFRNAPLEENLPVVLGLLNVWNVTFLGCPARAILPYSQALQKLAPHIQQVSMESNGKGVAIDGTRFPYQAGEIVEAENVEAEFLQAPSAF